MIGFGRKPQLVYFAGKVGGSFWGLAGHLFDISPERRGGVLLGAKIVVIPRAYRAVTMAFGLNRVTSWLLRRQVITFPQGGQYIPRNCFKPSLETIIYNHDKGKEDRILIYGDLQGNPNRENDIVKEVMKFDDLLFENEVLKERVNVMKENYAVSARDSRGLDKEAITVRMDDLEKLVELYMLTRETRKDKESDVTIKKREMLDMWRQIKREESGEGEEGIKEKIKKMVKRE